VAAPERAIWHADVSMMSAGGQYQLTSAVGSADVSVDRSTGNGVSGSGDPLASLTSRLTGGVHRSGWENGKGKGARLQFLAESDGPARSGPSTWLGSQAGSVTTRQAGSGCGRLAWALDSSRADASSGPVAPWVMPGWAASPPPPLLLADWADPRIGLGRIQCGRNVCACSCVYSECVCVCVCKRTRRRGGVHGHRGRGVTTAAVAVWQKGSSL
jgi:hypothetical protein